MTPVPVACRFPQWAVGRGATDLKSSGFPAARRPGRSNLSRQPLPCCESTEQSDTDAPERVVLVAPGHGRAPSLRWVPSEADRTGSPSAGWFAGRISGELATIRNPISPAVNLSYYAGRPRVLRQLQIENPAAEANMKKEHGVLLQVPRKPSESHRRILSELGTVQHNAGDEPR